MAVGSSLLVLLLSGFVLSNLRSSFLTVTPWSEIVRHTGRSDGKQEGFPALNCRKREKIVSNSQSHEVNTVVGLYKFLGWKTY